MPSKSDYKNAKHILHACTEHMDADKLRLYTMILAVANAAEAVEVGSIGYVMAEMHSLSARDKSLLGSAIFMGMLLGGLFCGSLSDMVGRRPCFLLAVSLNFLGGVASFFAADNVGWLILCRIVGGIGIGGCVPVVFTIGTELFPSAQRGRLLTVVASFWMVGSIYTALVGWIMLGDGLHGDKLVPGDAGGNWHAFILVCALPVAFAALLAYLFIPESPVYLLNREDFPGLFHVLQTAISSDFFDNLSHEAVLLLEEDDDLASCASHASAHIAAAAAKGILVPPGSRQSSTGSTASAVNWDRERDRDSRLTQGSTYSALVADSMATLLRHSELSEQAEGDGLDRALLGDERDMGDSSEGADVAAAVVGPGAGMHAGRRGRSYTGGSVDIDDPTGGAVVVLYQGAVGCRNPLLTPHNDGDAAFQGHDEEAGDVDNEHTAINGSSCSSYSAPSTASVRGQGSNREAQERAKMLTSSSPPLATVTTDSDWELQKKMLIKFHESIVLLSVVWFTLSFGTYGIVIWINVLFDNMHLFNTYAASFLFALSNVPGNVFSFYYVDVFGRRAILLGGMCLSALSAVAFAVAAQYQSEGAGDSAATGAAVVVCAMLYGAFSVSGWNSLDCLSVETFPAPIRPTTMGILAAFGRLGAITAQFVFGVLEHQVMLLLLITAGLMLVGAACTRRLGDTSGSLSHLHDKLLMSR